jgi:hypothetical protein
MVTLDFTRLDINFRGNNSCVNFNLVRLAFSL